MNPRTRFQRYNSLPEYTHDQLLQGWCPQCKKHVFAVAGTASREPSWRDPLRDMLFTECPQCKEASPSKASPRVMLAALPPPPFGCC